MHNQLIGCIYQKFFTPLQKQLLRMTFDQITDNEKLWAVRYDDCLDNVLDSILGQWNDVVWLRNFFKANLDDLASYFRITDVNQAIYDTIEDSERLQCLIMDISPDANLDEIFRPLDNKREHTLVELARMEKVRRYMLDNNIIDKDSFDDYQREVQ